MNKLMKNGIVLSAMVFGAGCASQQAVASSTKTKIKPKKASSFPSTVNNPIPGEIIVKCAGIAKKGKNHCGANGHTCSGFAEKDFDASEWIYVREEVCNATPGKIVGKKRVVKG